MEEVSFSHMLFLQKLDFCTCFVVVCLYGYLCLSCLFILEAHLLCFLSHLVCLNAMKLLVPKCTFLCLKPSIVLNYLKKSAFVWSHFLIQFLFVC